ncbi:MAG: hypothetical protein HQM08_25420 [Candidatus Riflebacteria bacterium]|nr:hypothetical protein [Candidatus Riflebacteria bacterium]
MFKRTFSLMTLFFLIVGVVSAQIQVPISYDLGIGKKIDGNVIGGSICEPEGLVVTPETGTGSILVPYETIDKITGMTVGKNGKLFLYVALRSGKIYKSFTSITDTEPILIIQDESIDGGKTPGKIRKFVKAGFRGIPLIEFDAALTPEVDLDSIKKLASEFSAAIDAGDLEKAVTLHNKIGDLLENNDSTSKDGPESEKK